MDSAADCFTILPEYQIVLCKIYHYCVWPDNIRTHLRTKHKRLPRIERAQIDEDVRTWSGILRSPNQFSIPQSVKKPVQGLRLFQDGKQCLLEPDKCAFVCRSIGSLSKHWQLAHSWSVTGKRGGARTALSLQGSAQKRADVWRPVHCQRFFHTGRHTSHFIVHPENRGENNASRCETSQPESIISAVLQDLAALERDQEKQSNVACDENSAKETSPWLQLTRWLSYLHRKSLLDVAALVRQPESNTEPALLSICNSLERVIEDAYHSLCNNSINVFDQVRMNSFLQRPSAPDRPIIVKLQRSIWRHYTRIWKALLSFVVRTAQLSNNIQLRHQLTNRQASVLQMAVFKAEEMVQLSAKGEVVGEEATSALERVSDELDSYCLDLCISLLDHDLKGDLFESAAIGFLAAFAIDPIKGILKEAYHSTPSLSGFIKIA